MAKAFLTAIITGLIAAAVGTSAYGQSRPEQLNSRQWEQAYLCALAYSALPGLSAGLLTYMAIAARDQNPKKLRKAAQRYMQLGSTQRDLTSSVLTQLEAHFINANKEDRP